MEHVDIYMFPCYSCGNAAGQVNSLVTYLKGFNITNNPDGTGNVYGMLWCTYSFGGEEVGGRRRRRA